MCFQRPGTSLDAVALLLAPTDPLSDVDLGLILECVSA